MAHGRIMALPVALILCACATEQEETLPDRFSVTVEDSVDVARTVGGPLYDGDLFTLEPLVTLHQDADDPESLLFRAGSVTIGPDGRYYVNDRGNSRIAVFDGQGRFVQAIGRDGDGPAEFREPALQVFAGDVISVFDFNQQRESRFGLPGELLETTRVPGNGLAIGLQRLPDGRLLRFGVESRQEGEVGWSGRTLTLLSADGADTVWTLATDLVAENRLERIEVADGSYSTLSRDLPFPPVATARWVPGQGFLLAEGDRPELRWYDLEGRLTRRILFEPPLHELNPAAKEQYEERLWLQRVAAAERSGRTPQPVRDLYYPDRPGLFSWTTVDEAGNVWMLDTWSEELALDEAAGHRFHVVTADGRYLGTTLCPSVRFQLHGDRLTALLEDPETGEIVPTVFRIVPAVPGLLYP